MSPWERDGREDQARLGIFFSHIVRDTGLGQDYVLTGSQRVERMYYSIVSLSCRYTLNKEALVGLRQASSSVFH